MKRVARVFFIILFLLIDAVCMYIITNTRNRVNVVLLGDSEIFQTVGMDYNDEGFKISLNNQDINIEECEYDITSNVDTSLLGDYVVQYNIKYNNKEYHLERKISVVDNLAPVIESNLDEVTLGYCNNELINNLEYKAIDNYDGDITDKIVKEEFDDKYVLTVTDSNNNTITKTIAKKIGDKPSNKIELNGRASISIELGSSYNEEGAYLTDGCGNKIEGEVVSSGSVNTNKEGKYTINYYLKDDNNIKNKRTVTVYKETAKQATGSGIIYLTFDDGPSAYTQKILDTLDKYNIKATFFVTNQFKPYKNMIGEEARRGHSIGVHTLTHSWDIYKTSQSYWNDFNAMNDIIEQQTGKRTNILRFPGGTNNHMANKTSGKVGMSTLVNEVNAKGLHYFDWNVSVEDNGSCYYVKDSQSCIINNFKKQLNPDGENIVLMHDMKSYTANGLESMIVYAKNQGYTFKSINENTTPKHFKPYQ